MFEYLCTSIMWFVGKVCTFIMVDSKIFYNMKLNSNEQ